MARAATSTHSLGRPLWYEPGTFSTAPTEGLSWFGDDHSRLVVLESALPVGSGGRAATGRWAEYRWGIQQFPGLVVAPLDFSPSTIRSVDIGFCSRGQRWSDASGCGIADQLVRQIEQVDFPIPIIPTPVTIPGVGECFGTGSASAIPGATWAVEIGTRIAAPGLADDQLCVDFGITVDSSIDCFSPLGFFVLLGCVYDATARACGSFGVRAVDADHNDPRFTLRSLTIDYGDGRGNGPRVCSFPANIETFRSLVEPIVRSALEDGVNGALNGAVQQREFSLPGQGIAGTCNSEPGNIAFRSNCATPEPATLTPDQDCRQFLTGDPNSTAVRSSCEIRRGPPCLVQNDCGGSTAQTGYTCVTLSRCGGVTSGIPCTADEDCEDQQFPTCAPVGGRCVDAEPLCYWNAEVDRIETLPSRLEIILADTEADETAVAFAETGALPLLQLEAANVCRPSDLGAFSGAADVSGALEPAPGAPIPGAP